MIIEALRFLLKFAVVPLIVGVIMYLFVHYQLYFFHVLLKVDISEKLRKDICIATFILAVVASIVLIGINEFFMSFL